MRINRFVAMASGLSRRAADTAIKQGRVAVNGQTAEVTSVISESDHVTLDDRSLRLPEGSITILLHKPTGYVVGRNGQGNRTIYDLLPPELSKLKPVGRLDKDSSGVLLLTTDGQLSQSLTHPSYNKNKVYEVELDKPLKFVHNQLITGPGVLLEDGPSRFNLSGRGEDSKTWRLTMAEGRNRQIRRTFLALGYEVTKLHRTVFGSYSLPANLTSGKYIYLSQ
jgi:23S rRNA pseudouridine2605 synthase